MNKDEIIILIETQRSIAKSTADFEFKLWEEKGDELHLSSAKLFQGKQRAYEELLYLISINKKENKGKTIEEMKLSGMHFGGEVWEESYIIWVEYRNSHFDRWIDPKKYAVVIEYDQDCPIATNGAWISAWKGKVLRNNEVVFSFDIELYDYTYKKHAFLKTFEVFMRYKKGETLVHIHNALNIENVVYNEELDK